MKKTNSLDWGNILFIGSYHLILLICLPFYLAYFTPTIGLIISAILLYIVSGLSITVGYHRLFSHRTFRTNRWVEAVVLFFGALTIENSALKWSSDHRRHHAFVDTDQDPYSVKKGFWYAHWLWIFHKGKPIEPKTVPDLLNNKRVMFQHRWYLPILAIGSILIVIIPGWLCGDYFGAFVITFLLRLFCLHHCTFFINSLAHKWGEKPFALELSAVDNYFLAFLTFGEGYHNFHHACANDYRNGIKWYHFDPGKWIIWTLNKCGLAHSLKKMNDEVIMKKRILADRELALKNLPHFIDSFSCPKIQKSIEELSNKVLDTLNQFCSYKKQITQLANEQVSRLKLKEMKVQLVLIKMNFRSEWRHWKKLLNSLPREIFAMPK